MSASDMGFCGVNARRGVFLTKIFGEHEPGGSGIRPGRCARTLYAMKTRKLALLALCLFGGATAGASAQPIVVAPAPPPPAPGVVVIGPGPGLLFVSPR